MNAIRTRPEALSLGILLAVVGGYLDAHAFVGHGAFATAQTGNVVLSCVEIAGGNWGRALVHLPSILAFLLGVAVAETLGRPAVQAFLRRPTRVVLVVEAAVLTVLGAVPAGAPDLPITAAVSFVAALQVSTFRLLVDTAYSTTMITGDLRSMSAELYKRLATGDQDAGRRAKRLGGVIAGFVVGAVSGAFLTHQIGNRAVWGAAGVLLIVLAGIMLETRRLEAAPPPGEHL